LSTTNKELTVKQVAALCDVDRTTVGYWVRSKKLYANRKGRRYAIPVEELRDFLKSIGQKIPPELKSENFQKPYFRAIENCWQFWHANDHAQNCNTCFVYKNHIDTCFTLRGGSSLKCTHSCEACKYYQENYFARINFIHQIDMPAAVYKDLYIWGANTEFAELCGIPQNDLVGIGIEQIAHPDSMESVISFAKRRAAGDPAVPRYYRLYIRKNQQEKKRISMSVQPLKDPTGTFLVLAETEIEA